MVWTEDTICHFELRFCIVVVFTFCLYMLYSEPVPHMYAW